ncbi:MAG: hypothetical protein EBR09_01590 [Proteobacteria bacterium]|nr:hypothetical protein [Pseudomonadota bacterium]
MMPKLRGAAAPLTLVLLAFPVCSSTAETHGRSVAVNEKYKIDERVILDVQKPGYLNFAVDPATKAPHLLISGFQAFGKDHLTSITGWDRGLTSTGELDTAVLNKEITWPNEARMVESKIFSGEGLLVAGGFLVPGKSTGAVTFVPWNHPENAVVLTTPKKGWYYHRTEEWDVNSDGLIDLVTARGTMPMVGKPDGELIWLENPGPASAGMPWKEHFIARGPDVHFRILNHALPASEKDLPLTIISTEFSTRKLTVLRRTEDGNFQNVVLDNTLGAAFDIQLNDLNADGKIDLLVTNHEPDSKASVFGYEFDPYTLKILKRHTLLTGIETRQKGIKQASPGTILAFHPTLSAGNASSKPWILVSGDGSQRAHLLVPENENGAENWSYREHVIWNAESTVGQSTVGDLDGDGRIEIIIPAYDKNKVAVFTVTPLKLQSPRRR